jgi:hypothetical protein
MKGARIPYSAAEMAWLDQNRSMVISDYHAAFVAAFGRTDVSAKHLHSLRKRKGWKVGRAKGRTKGRRRKYTPAQAEWLGANRTLAIADYHRLFREAFPEADVTPGQLHALRKREGWRTGRTGCFAKGAAPANKGKRCPDGIGGRHPNARRTQFKKGALPVNTKWLGHERINVDGYVEVSIAETNPHTGFERRYVHKHVWLWERANGPVPDGHCLKCLDGDKTNTSPANWECIPRAVLARLNGGRNRKRLAYDAASPEVKPVLMTIAKIEHRARAKMQACVAAIMADAVPKRREPPAPSKAVAA